MSLVDTFSEIITPDYPLGPRTSFGVGGKAEFLAKPRSAEELAKLLAACSAEGVPFRVFGGGSNILVRDEGVRGVVIDLEGEPFSGVTVEGNQVQAGASASLGELITQSCSASLAGMESLVGIPGTVGGALRTNAGGRTGDIGQFVHSVEMMDESGERFTRMRADIRFSYRHSNLDDGIILSAKFDLVSENPEDLVRRIKKLWIAKKASQPFSFQRAGYVFRNPRGLSADELIEGAGLRGTKIGGAEISDRDPRFIVAQPGATSDDILRLIDMARTKIDEQMGVSIELQIDIW